MQLITVAGSPSVGKTSVILRVAELLRQSGLKVGVAKFDALSTVDDELYAQKGIPVAVGLAGSLCPDHYFVSNVEDCLAWGERQGFDLLISESAGLCNRCSPHIDGVLAICVVDALAGVHTPKKIGPMLRLADLVVITKGDIVSQVEREVFAFHVRLANPGAQALFCNGITGQGATDIVQHIRAAAPTPSLDGSRLRFSMPAAVCPYCVGETAIGETHQRGNVKKMRFADLEAAR
ncbi:GTP-binding protein [Plasticicumulans acidivorans]|uniref:Hydrogenase maturation factor HypB n=1 Tax=Plasticicumulans acidivorans TaxID=886464 RepID=A0A317MYX8_9GAMM|nr:GTP-binding protein [Plasticicumulans acidivorans]PWV61002.1 Ni2+-binding GTPase involved in maturation of urease and hydrogenase [Plasticicumulans acidivorans]